MRLVIHQILLYPSEAHLRVRAVNFEPGTVNVVTGTSGRGKSAITHIIDYCLGSGKCGIPLGPIRDTVSWYALVVEIEGALAFIARKSPGRQQSTDDYVIRERSDFSVPLRPEKSSSRLSFLTLMNGRAGLSNLDLAGGQPKNPSDARASFRDFAAFNFLPQHIVANPQTLFFKADTSEHRDKLRKVLPLALGAVDAEYLLAEHEERDLQRRIQLAEEELDRRVKAMQAFTSELRSFVDRGKELGFITDASISESTSTEVLVGLLREVLQNGDKALLDADLTGRTEVAVTRLAQILREEGRVAGEIGDRRRQLQRLTELTESVRRYTDQLRIQHGRVSSAGWFFDHVSQTGSCPLCGSVNEGVRAEVRELVDAARQLDEQIAAASGQAPVALERQELDLRQSIRDLEGQLTAWRRERRELEQSDLEARNSRQRSDEVSRFIGRLEQALAGYDLAALEGELARRLSSLKNQLTEVRKRMNAQDRNSKEAAALKSIADLARPTARLMNLERRDDKMELIPRDLALAFGGGEARRDYLWEIGSGENWMGYHIAVLLALHEFFLGLERSPVPSFLVIDQPTQVYFPTQGDSYDRDRDQLGKSGDLIRARRIFDALRAGVERTEGKLQIIVTEHADELTWGQVSGVRLVENWRDERFLIPLSWLLPSSSGDKPNASSDE